MTGLGSFCRDIKTVSKNRKRSIFRAELTKDIGSTLKSGRKVVVKVPSIAAYGPEKGGHDLIAHVLFRRQQQRRSLPPIIIQEAVSIAEYPPPALRGGEHSSSSGASGPPSASAAEVLSSDPRWSPGQEAFVTEAFTCDVRHLITLFPCVIISPQACAAIVAPLIDTIDALHEDFTVYGDMKPDNILVMLTASGIEKLSQIDATLLPDDIEKVVLGDLGSCVTVSKPRVYVTNAYLLANDTSATATYDQDWVALLITFLELMGVRAWNSPCVTQSELEYFIAGAGLSTVPETAQVAVIASRISWSAHVKGGGM